MRNWRTFRLLLCVLPLASAVGCGQLVVTHRLEISIADPTGRLGPPPYEVGVFDWHMGRSEEWARKTSGVAAPGAPFLATQGDVVTKIIFDTSPARRVSVAVWVPAYEKAGFFALDIEPTAGTESTVTLPFVPWGDSYPEGARIVPLQAKLHAEAGERGAWNLRLTIEVP